MTSLMTLDMGEITTVASMPGSSPHDLDPGPQNHYIISESVAILIWTRSHGYALRAIRREGDGVAEMGPIAEVPAGSGGTPNAPRLFGVVPLSDRFMVGYMQGSWWYVQGLRVDPETLVITWGSRQAVTSYNSQGMRATRIRSNSALVFRVAYQNDPTFGPMPYLQAERVDILPDLSVGAVSPMGSAAFNADHWIELGPVEFMPREGGWDAFALITHDAPGWTPRWSIKVIRFRDVFPHGTIQAIPFELDGNDFSNWAAANYWLTELSTLQRVELEAHPDKVALLAGTRDLFNDMDLWLNMLTHDPEAHPQSAFAQAVPRDQRLVWEHPWSGGWYEHGVAAHGRWGLGNERLSTDSPYLLRLLDLSVYGDPLSATQNPVTEQTWEIVPPLTQSWWLADYNKPKAFDAEYGMVSWREEVAYDQWEVRARIYRLHEPVLLEPELVLPLIPENLNARSRGYGAHFNPRTSVVRT